jgi:hypothetical protein
MWCSGQLVMELYSHAAEADARARLIAARDAQTGRVPHRVDCKMTAGGVIGTSSPSERRLTNE